MIHAIFSFIFYFGSTEQFFVRQRVYVGSKADTDHARYAAGADIGALAGENTYGTFNHSVS